MHGTFEYAQLLIPIYNDLYERADALMRRFNPCNVCDGVCERFRRGEGKNFCCSADTKGCVYLGPEGCRVKALRCKIWVCNENLIHPSNLRAFSTEMWNILITAEKFKLLVVRGSMEDSIAQACRAYTQNRLEREAMTSEARNYKRDPLFLSNGLVPAPPLRRVTASFTNFNKYSEVNTAPIELTDEVKE